MYEFIVQNWYIFIIIAAILLFGLIGYFMDRKKYEDYREEIINEGRVVQTMQAQPEVSNVAAAIPVSQPQVVQQNDPVTGQIQN